MANKQALSDLQARLAERLSAVKTEPRGKSWLAVECGEQGFLFPLSEAGEIFPVASLLLVPHTQPWFLGVANLRGHLHGVVDLAAFLGLGLGLDSTRTAHDRAHLVGFNLGLEINCALLVDRLCGLRGEHELQPDASVAAARSRPAFAGVRYRDAGGRPWQELELRALAGDEAFLRILA